MSHTIPSKLPATGTNIFTVMSQLAMEHNAINLGQGFPDWQMDERITDLVNKAMRDGFNQYTHSNGLPALRQQLAAKATRLYGQSVDGDKEITITPGGTYAIYTALTTIVNKGDEVIYFEPAYDSYRPNIEINGGVAKAIRLKAPDFRIPWDEVKHTITDRTRAIILNTPHNPTGTVLKQEDIEALKQLSARHEFFIISDEVYEHLIMDGYEHLSMLRYSELYERSFVCFSFGKTYHCTGWKTGYCIAPEALSKEFRKVHQFNAFSCFSPVQKALADHLAESRDYEGLGAFMQQKRDLFQELMAQTRLKALPSHGSYFQCYSYAHFSEEPDRAFAERLIREAKVVCIPVSAFYHDGFDQRIVRFCFAKKEETLREAAGRLRDF